MEKEICKMHVFKRFSIFEWAFLLVSVNILLFVFELVAINISLYLLCFSVFAVAMLSRFAFNSNNYNNFDQRKVFILVGRRYEDLVRYLILKSLYFLLIFPIVALYAIIWISCLALIFYLVSALLAPFLNIFGAVFGFFLGFIFYTILFGILYILLLALLVKLNILDSLLLFFKHVVAFIEKLLILLGVYKFLSGINKLKDKISSLQCI
jgi:hypothetical protein